MPSPQASANSDAQPAASPDSDAQPHASAISAEAADAWREKCRQHLRASINKALHPARPVEAPDDQQLRALLMHKAWDISKEVNLLFPDPAWESEDYVQAARSLKDNVSQLGGQMHALQMLQQQVAVWRHNG
jgi:hypothetical protein